MNSTFEKRRELLRRAMRGFARQEIAPRTAESEEMTELIQDLNTRRLLPR